MLDFTTTVVHYTTRDSKSRSKSLKNWKYVQEDHTDYVIRISDWHCQHILRHTKNDQLFLGCRYARDQNMSSLVEIREDLTVNQAVALRKRLETVFNWHNLWNFEVPAYAIPRMEAILDVFKARFGIATMKELLDKLWLSQERSIVTDLKVPYCHDLHNHLYSLKKEHGITKFEDFTELIKESSLREAIVSSLKHSINSYYTLNFFRDTISLVKYLKSINLDINYIHNILSVNTDVWSCRNIPSYLTGLPIEDLGKWSRLIKEHGKTDYYLRDTCNMYKKYKKGCEERGLFPEKISLINTTLIKLHEDLVKLQNKLDITPKPVFIPECIKDLDKRNTETHKFVIPKTNVDLKNWGQIMRNCIGGYTPSERQALVAISDTEDRLLYNLEIRLNKETQSVQFAQFSTHGNRQVDEETKEPLKQIISKHIKNVWKKDVAEMLTLAA